MAGVLGRARTQRVPTFPSCGTAKPGPSTLNSSTDRAGASTDPGDTTDAPPEVSDRVRQRAGAMPARNATRLSGTAFARAVPRALQKQRPTAFPPRPLTLSTTARRDERPRCAPPGPTSWPPCTSTFRIPATRPQSRTNSTIRRLHLWCGWPFRRRCSTHCPRRDATRHEGTVALGLIRPRVRRRLAIVEVA